MAMGDNLQPAMIGPNPCRYCGGEYGDHTDSCDVLRAVIPPPTSNIPAGHIKMGNVIRPAEHMAEHAAAMLLRWAHGDPDSPEHKDTPARMVKALTEMTEGYRINPAEILGKTFSDPCDEIIISAGIPFTSLCEHHLLPFSGTADVGYLPSEKGEVVGLSKLARLVDCFSRRLQLQERLTREIATTLQSHLGARGVAVVVRGEHSCMSCRGVRKPGSVMITSVMLGVFRDKPEARAEFLNLCRI